MLRSYSALFGVDAGDPEIKICDRDVEEETTFRNDNLIAWSSSLKIIFLCACFCFVYVCECQASFKLLKQIRTSTELCINIVPFVEFL